MEKIVIAGPHHIPEVIEWLKAEDHETGEGFFCNRGVIERSFEAGEGLCAIRDGGIVGFSVFQAYGESCDIHIIEVKPSERRLGIGSRLLLATVDLLRQTEAKYIDVECTSEGGKSLCLRHNFERYVDPRNYRSEGANPLLRLYLTEWRPPPPNPWA